MRGVNLSKSGNIFFASAFSFAAAAVIELILDFAFPIPFELVDQYRASGLVHVAGGILFFLTLVGLLGFIWGLISAFNQRMQQK